ncbi:MAG: hypothetical protein ACMG6E_04940 [Candidatus Roizmanbacteria bacterium]
MEQFLDNMSYETLQDLRATAQRSIDRGQENQIDGEAEIDKLLMMHMSKNHHGDEVEKAVESSSSSIRIMNIDNSNGSDHGLVSGSFSKTINLEQEINNPRNNSMKKKRNYQQRGGVISMPTQAVPDQIISDEISQQITPAGCQTPFDNHKPFDE